MMDIMQQLSDLDHLLFEQLAKTEIEAEDIAQLVDRREQLLHCFLMDLAEKNSLKQTPQSQAVLARTQILHQQMQMVTRQVGDELYKLRHGQRSIQQYKKFL